MFHAKMSNHIFLIQTSIYIHKYRHKHFWDCWRAGGRARTCVCVFVHVMKLQIQVTFILYIQWLYIFRCSVFTKICTVLLALGTGPRIYIRSYYITTDITEQEIGA
jgi:hypothetical protein